MSDFSIYYEQKCHELFETCESIRDSFEDAYDHLEQISSDISDCISELDEAMDTINSQLAALELCIRRLTFIPHSRTPGKPRYSRSIRSKPDSELPFDMDDEEGGVLWN